MHDKAIAATAFFALITPSFAYAAKPPLQLKPTSAWQVDYANDHCRLARQFGEGDDVVHATFDRYGPGEYFRLTLAGNPMRTAVQKADATVQFGPVEKEQQLYFFNGYLGKMPALVFASGARVAPPSDSELLAIQNRGKDDEWIELAQISEERHKAIKYLTVGKPLRRAVTLETGSMRKPFAAMDSCIDNLVASWGVDVEKHKSLSRSVVPKQSPGRWIVSSDYPLDMLSVGQPAIVEFRLSVGADGMPTACHIQSTTRPKEFDDAVCRSVMRRARFEPALDAEGKPLASYYRNTVRFQLP
ncbi:MAG: energy transducer TonB [Sphingomonadaceae bacterium]|nr:energy transducer TonB [Sphingomonadaceae bacterium]